MALSDNDHHDMFTSQHIIIPFCKEPRISEALTSANLIGVCKCIADSILVIGEQIRMVLGYMSLTLTESSTSLPK